MQLFVPLFPSEAGRQLQPAEPTETATTFLRLYNSPERLIFDASRSSLSFSSAAATLICWRGFSLCTESLYQRWFLSRSSSFSRSSPPLPWQPWLLSPRRRSMRQESQMRHSRNSYTASTRIQSMKPFILCPTSFAMASSTMTAKL